MDNVSTWARFVDVTVDEPLNLDFRPSHPRFIDDANKLRGTEVTLSLDSQTEEEDWERDFQTK